MVKFTATILKTNQPGDKNGWTYIHITPDIAEQLKPDNKQSFRVKGKLDSFAIKAVALMPIGGGNFMMPLNADLRKGIKKKVGAMVQVQIQEDKAPLKVPADFMECLADEPAALDRFNNQLPLSHRNYFIKWVDGVKGEAARAKRIAMTIEALNNNWGFSEMFRVDRERKGKGT